MTVVARKSQLRRLELFYQDVSPPGIVIHGPPSTGKSVTLKHFLSERDESWSSIKCEDCATGRILLQHALRAIFEATKTGVAADAVCENLSVFAHTLKERFQERNFLRRHTLILDHADKLQEHSDLYGTMCRLKELFDLDNLIIVFVLSSPELASFQSSQTPQIWFPRYSTEEAVLVLCQDSLLCPVSDLPVDSDTTSRDSFRQQFLEALVGTLDPYAGTDIRMLRRAAHFLWPQFISGLTSLNFRRAFTSRKLLFSSEAALVPHLTQDETKGLSETKYWLLCAAYLASYSPPRYDGRLFSRAKEARAKRRQTHPKKSQTVPPRSLAPPAFEIERFLAIYHALVPDPHLFVPSVDVQVQIASLVRQNCIVQRGDPLDSRTKWKINVSWSFIQSAARKIDFPIEEFLFDQW